MLGGFFLCVLAFRAKLAKSENGATLSVVTRDMKVANGRYGNERFKPAVITGILHFFFLIVESGVRETQSK